MATSNSINFNMTRDQIIKFALKRLQVFRNNTVVPVRENEDANIVLNAMIKAWQNEGLFQYQTKEVTIFTEGNVAQYSIGATNDPAALDDDLVITNLSAAAATSDTTIYLNTVEGIEVDDIVLLVLDSGLLHSTTVNTVGMASITVDDALGSSAADNNRVFIYTTKMNRPLKIESARWQQADGTETILEKYEHDSYFEIVNKTETGQPTAYYYNPNRSTPGTLYLWPVPEDSTGVVRASVIRTIEDFDSANDDPDFPQEMFEALYLNLAWRLAPFYEKPQAFINYLGQEAMASYESILTSALQTGGGDVQVTCE